jgi:hypothetical protein
MSVGHQGEGRLLFEQIVKTDLEGIVRKRKDSLYKIAVDCKELAIERRVGSTGGKGWPARPALAYVPSVELPSSRVKTSQVRIPAAGRVLGFERIRCAAV